MLAKLTEPVGPCSRRSPIRDGVEPGAERIVDADRGGFSDQGEESSLEGILYVVRIVQEMSANFQNHRAMPGEDCLESYFLTAIDVTFQDLAIGTSGERSLAEDSGDQVISHGSHPPDGSLVHSTGSDSLIPPIYTHDTIFNPRFFGKIRQLHGESRRRGTWVKTKI